MVVGAADGILPVNDIRGQGRRLLELHYSGITVICCGTRGGAVLSAKAFFYAR